MLKGSAEKPANVFLYSKTCKSAGRPILGFFVHFLFFFIRFYIFMSYENCKSAGRPILGFCFIFVNLNYFMYFAALQWLPRCCFQSIKCVKVAPHKQTNPIQPLLPFTIRSCRCSSFWSSSLSGSNTTGSNSFIPSLRFLIKEIDEDKFKKLLQQEEKKYEKIKEARFTMSMFNTALGDMLRRVYAETSTTGVHELIKEMNKLRTYTNRCFWERRGQVQVQSSTSADGQVVAQERQFVLGATKV